MKAYLKIDIEGGYVEFDKPLDTGIYDNIGNAWEDFSEGKWIPLTEKQMRFKKENPSAGPYEIFFMKAVKEKSAENLLETAKFNKSNDVLSYDKSAYVNQFFINGIPLWFSKEERANLIMRFNAEKHNGGTDTKFWYHDYEFTLTIDNAYDIIYAVEVYASRCYDRTKQHLINIKNMKTVDEIEKYDITVGYPKKLEF